MAAGRASGLLIWSAHLDSVNLCCADSPLKLHQGLLDSGFGTQNKGEDMSYSGPSTVTPFKSCAGSI